MLLTTVHFPQSAWRPESAAVSQDLRQTVLITLTIYNLASENL